MAGAADLNPDMEFVDDPLDLREEPKGDDRKPDVPAVTQEDVAKLRQEMQAKVAELESIKGKTAILDKVKELFTGKTEDPKDKFVTDEIRRRLGNELDDLDKLKKVVPMVLEMLDIDAKERLEERVDAARDALKTQMGKAGLETDDDSVGYLEEALSREIKGNKELLDLWNKGRIKSAVDKAFDKVQSKLFAPSRVRVKRDAVSAINDAPKASPRGSAGTATGRGARNEVDTSDTSRDGIRKIHDAAFERLNELMDK